jgi:KAP family P-loop domain
LINASGHDAPIFQLEQDYYDRWPIAMSISKIIESSPIEWSTRIGLFGKWGEGKTSVLNFLEQQQRKSGNIVIKYSPWGVSNEQELWKDFGKALVQGLKENKLGITHFKTALHWIKRNGSVTQKAIKDTGTVAELSGYAPGAKIGAELISNLIMSRLGIKRNDIEALAQKLGKRRLVVFIDDLDRTDPSVIPKLLLVLRELLDFKQFIFVLAFDREIISSALNTYNVSWDGDNFLEKVIDFQITLPIPTKTQVNNLAIHQFRNLCPFVPTSAINDIASLLPANPRKLKLLSRSVSSMKDEVARHDQDELDWSIILLLELFKIENNQLVQRLLYMSTESGKFTWLSFGQSKEEKALKEADEVNELINSIPDLEKSRVRIEQLIKAWRERLTIGNTATLNYQAMFALAPHSITWGEFKEFFGDWRSSRASQKVQSFINERIVSNRSQSVSVQEELAVTVLEYHAILLDRASNTGSAEAHKQLIDEASDTLDFFDKSFCGANPYMSLSPENLQLSWNKFYNTAMHWAHWVRNDGELKLRENELEILIKLAATIKNPIATYDRVIPGIGDFTPFGRDQMEKRMALTEGIRKSCELQALSVAYEFIRLPGKITSLRSESENQGARFILTAPKSIAYSESQIANTTAVWESRRDTDRAAEDALTFLELLLVACDYGDRYCSKDDRAEFSRTQSEFIVTIWNLCISCQRQFRMLSDMRKIRDAFIAQGIDAAKLIIPDWLSAE